MHASWGLPMTAAGLFMFLCGTLQSDFIIYRLLVARSRILWGEHVHRFYQAVGIIVLIAGLLVASGLLGRLN